MEVATLAGGCFWCTEAIFRRLAGVIKVTSGYTGGQVANPTYGQVCSGSTGHAEAIQIQFDSAKIRYETILEVFLATHDPTTLNRQGADVGTQYRSAIFYHSEEQKRAAEGAVGQIQDVVTEITPASEFFPAEIDHQQYYEINPRAAYCSLVIGPKIHKLLERYGELISPGYK